LDITDPLNISSNNELQVEIKNPYYFISEESNQPIGQVSLPPAKMPAQLPKGLKSAVLESETAIL